MTSSKNGQNKACPTVLESVVLERSHAGPISRVRNLFFRRLLRLCALLCSVDSKAFLLGPVLLVSDWANLGFLNGTAAISEIGQRRLGTLRPLETRRENFGKLNYH